jgi:serine/threonine protein kinase
MVDFRDIKLSAIAMDFLKGVLRIDPLERFSAHEALNHKWF